MCMCKAESQKYRNKGRRERFVGLASYKFMTWSAIYCFVHLGSSPVPAPVDYIKSNDADNDDQGHKWSLRHVWRHF